MLATKLLELQKEMPEYEVRRIVDAMNGLCIYYGLFIQKPQSNAEYVRQRDMFVLKALEKYFGV